MTSINVIHSIGRESLDKIIEMIGRADEGKLTFADRQEVQQELKTNENLWLIAGDLASSAVTDLVGKSAGGNEVVAETIYHGCDVVKAKLGYADSPMIERLLIDAIVLAWLRWGQVERTYNAQIVTPKSHTQQDGIYWERRLDAAQRRLFRALAALAKMRKLDLPAIQINIGDQQVNVVGKHNGD